MAVTEPAKYPRFSSGEHMTDGQLFRDCGIVRLGACRLGIFGIRPDGHVQ